MVTQSPPRGSSQLRERVVTVVTMGGTIDKICSLAGKVTKHHSDGRFRADTTSTSAPHIETAPR
jgi:hypothetical protein